MRRRWALLGALVVVLLLVAGHDEFGGSGAEDPPCDTGETVTVAQAPVLRGRDDARKGVPEPPPPNTETASGGAAGSWTVSGLVLDLEQRPLPGVPVMADRTEIVATSARDGTFACVTERSRVWLAPGPGWTGHSEPASPARPSVVLQAIRLAKLEIRFVGPDDEPIEGLRDEGRHPWVAEREDSGSWNLVDSPWPFGPTDADGRCIHEIAESTIALTLEVEHGGLVAHQEFDFPARRRFLIRLRRRLAVAGTVHGLRERTRDPDGWLVARPLDPARPVVRVPARYPFRGGSQTGAPASFRFLVPGAGPWLVSFSPQDHRLAESEPVRVRAPADDLHLYCPPAANVAGRVLGLNPGELQAHWLPAPGRSGLARPASQDDVGDDGRFEIWRVAPGAGRLFLRSRNDDRYGLIENLEAPLHGVTVQLTKGVSLVGGLDGFEPRPATLGASLRIRAEGDGIRASTTVRDDGAFRIRGLPPGRYALSWRWFWDTRSSVRWVPFVEATAVDPEAGVIRLPAPK